MDNRTRYKSLLTEHKLTQAESAALICSFTKRPCGVRTVRSWLNDPEKPSSYPCPDWAVDALAGAIKERDQN
ncbi:hypothetical protein CX658_30820 [Pseudomonas amygdali pv. lachrymans]|nr:hypothetical protein CX658_30820 [Pseudomonas amygdali pv. lachrymans]